MAKKKTTKKSAKKTAKRAVKKKTTARKTTRKKSTKKTSASAARKKSTTKKKVKKAARKTSKKATKKSTKTTAKKKVTLKSATPRRKKSVTKKKSAATSSAPPATKPKVVPGSAARPKRPRRTKQAVPPPMRVVPPPVIDAKEITTTTAPLDADVIDAPHGTPTPAAPAPVKLDVGDVAPDFALPDQHGQVHRLADYRGQHVVLYFYPKDDTPGCTVEACGFRDSLGRFTDHTAVVLGVSPDSAESHARFAQKYGLTFPLLADVEHRVAERYGVWVEKNMYGRVRMGIERTTFVIAPDGRITHVFRKVKAAGHEKQVLDVL